MILKTLPLLSALALSANALLVPPRIASDATSDIWAGTEGVVVASVEKSIDLPCPSCPVAVGTRDGSPVHWTNEPETALQLSFSAEGKKLSVNGVPFYPPMPSNLRNAMKAKQVYAEGAENKGELFEGALPLSATIDVQHQVEVPSVNVKSLEMTKTPIRTINFEILGIADKVVHVDTIELRLVEKEDEWTLLSLTTTPYNPNATPYGDACQTIMCRVRAAITAKIAAWRAAASHGIHRVKIACMRKFGKFLPGGHRHHHHGHHHHNDLKLKGGVAKFSGDSSLNPANMHPHDDHEVHHGKAHRMGHHGHHYGHGKGAARFGCRKHHILRAVGRFMHHVVLPILVGIAAGMAVSGIGMLLGQAAVCAYRAIRGRRVTYVRLAEDDEEVVEAEVVDVKEGLPRYEDVYVQVDGEFRDEKE